MKTTGFKVAKRTETTTVWEEAYISKLNVICNSLTIKVNISVQISVQSSLSPDLLLVTYNQNNRSIRMIIASTSSSRPFKPN
jgi:hypothetical protein